MGQTAFLLSEYHRLEPRTCAALRAGALACWGTCIAYVLGSLRRPHRLRRLHRLRRPRCLHYLYACTSVLPAVQIAAVRVNFAGLPRENLSTTGFSLCPKQRDHTNLSVIASHMVSHGRIAVHSRPLLCAIRRFIHFFSLIRTRKKFVRITYKMCMICSFSVHTLFPTYSYSQNFCPNN